MPLGRGDGPACTPAQAAAAPSSRLWRAAPWLAPACCGAPHWAGWLRSAGRRAPGRAGPPPGPVQPAQGPRAAPGRCQPALLAGTRRRRTHLLGPAPLPGGSCLSFIALVFGSRELGGAALWGPSRAGAGARCPALAGARAGPAPQPCTSLLCSPCAPPLCALHTREEHPPTSFMHRPLSPLFLVWPRPPRHVPPPPEAAQRAAPASAAAGRGLPPGTPRRRLACSLARFSHAPSALSRQCPALCQHCSCAINTAHASGRQRAPAPRHTICTCARCDAAAD